MNPEITVVIATYERPVLLLRCVDALLAQTLAPERFEIVIVDDGSSRATRENVIAELGARRRVRRAPILRFLWQPENRGPAAARN
jgi:glycosyltransferase involved in cell wall biosynthesis